MGLALMLFLVCRINIINYDVDIIRISSYKVIFYKENYILVTPLQMIISILI